MNASLPVGINPSPKTPYRPTQQAHHNSPRMTLATFAVLIRQAFLQSTVFRANYLIGLLSDLLFVYLSIQVWTVLYSNQILESGPTTIQLITYVTLARIVAPVDMEFVQNMQQRVLSGEIAGELIKPIPLSWFLLAQEVGRYISRLLLRVLPIALLVFFTISLSVPDSPIYILLFVVSIILSFIIMFSINYITALAAFWITQLFSINVLKGQTVRLLSGILVPLWFFPAAALPVIELLPFASIAFVPIQLFLEEISIVKACYSLALQLAWGIIIWQIGRWMWSRAVRQLSINGG